MAWRIADSVIRGEIDNRQKGRVTGRIWLAGRKEPLELELQGNALRDLAGRRLRFENPKPKPGQPIDLKPQQRGWNASNATCFPSGRKFCGSWKNTGRFDSELARAYARASNNLGLIITSS